MVFPVAAVVVVFEFTFECAFGNYRLDVGIGIAETEAGSNIIGSAGEPDRKHRQGGLEEFFGSQRQRLAGKAMHLQQAEVFGAITENRLGGNQLQTGGKGTYHEHFRLAQLCHFAHIGVGNVVIGYDMTFCRH